jgi:uncharacterized protein YukE
MAPPSKQDFRVNDESSPEGSWNGKYEDFKALGDGLDIRTFQNSADPYSSAQSLLMQTYEELTTQAYLLADKWQGKAAAEFQNNLRALYVSACNLADATGKVSVAIGYHASDLQTLKENVDKMKPDESTTFMDVMFGDTWDPLGISHRTTDVEANDNAANDAVKKWMNQDLTNNTTTYTFGELPKQVQVEIPNPTPGVNKPGNQGLPNGPGGGGGGIPHMGSPGAHGGGGAPHLNSPTPHLNSPNPHMGGPNSHPPLDPPGTHGGPGGGGADLAGLNPHGGGGLGKGLGPGGGGLGDGLGPGGGGLKGLDPHGLGGGGLGGGGLGGGGLGGAGLGSGGLGGARGKTGGLAGAAAQEEAAAARAGAAGRGGTNGMPMGMGGGGGGGQEQERERTTWLTEDEDVWGGDGDVAPPVIG